VEAWVRFPSILAKGCCTVARVDCTGLCGGSARIDQCGFCSGGDTGLVPNHDQDCFGLCPNDPKRIEMERKAKESGTVVDCNPEVDTGPAIEIPTDGTGSGSESGSGQSGGSGSGSSTNNNDQQKNTTASGSRVLKWEINNDVVLKSDQLIKTWEFKVKNDGPIRVYIEGLMVTNTPKDSETHPPVFINHNAARASFGTNVWVIESLR
jgi:hypothetical protein